MAVENKGDAGTAGAQEGASITPDAAQLGEKIGGSSGGNVKVATEKGGGNPGSMGKGGGGGGGGKGPGKGSGKGDEAKGPVASIQRAQQFFKEVLIEFKKISWPDRAQVMRETWSVLLLVTIITVLVLGFDAFLSKLVFGPIDQWIRTHINATHGL
jgi:preprotein translocase SecE subunit